MIFKSAKNFHPFFVSILLNWNKVFEHKDSGFNKEIASKAIKEAREQGKNDSLFYGEIKFTFLNDEEPRIIFCNTTGEFMTEVDKEFHIFNGSAHSSEYGNIYVKGGLIDNGIEIGIKKPFHLRKHLPGTDDSHYSKLLLIPAEIFDIFKIKPYSQKEHTEKVNLIEPLLSKYDLTVEDKPQLDIDSGWMPLRLSHPYAISIEIGMI